MGPCSGCPLQLEDEVEAMGIELESPKVVMGEIDLAVGDQVTVVSGSFMDHVGEVEEINIEKREVKVYVNAFGRRASCRQRPWGWLRQRRKGRGAARTTHKTRKDREEPPATFSAATWSP